MVNDNLRVSSWFYWYVFDVATMANTGRPQRFYNRRTPWMTFKFSTLGLLTISYFMIFETWWWCQVVDHPCLFKFIMNDDTSWEQMYAGIVWTMLSLGSSWHLARGQTPKLRHLYGVKYGSDGTGKTGTSWFRMVGIVGRSQIPWLIVSPSKVGFRTRLNSIDQRRAHVFLNPLFAERDSSDKDIDA